MAMNRREFLFSATAASSFSFAKGGTNQIFSTESLEVTHHTLTYSTLPHEFDGFRFGFLTDFHLGGWVKTELVAQALKLASGQNIELLLHGGDYLWVPDSYGSSRTQFFLNNTFSGKDDEALAESIYEKIAELNRTYSYPLGSYGVLGNHDRWSNPTACYEYLPMANIALLENHMAVINKGSSQMEIFGTADFWTGVPELPKYSKDKKNTFKILLTHNPDFASYAYHKKQCSFHLALSGHTHGGQIKIPLLGPLTYNIEDSRYGEGLVDYGETKFFTSRGIGVVEVPVRILCPPEVAIFTLKGG